MKKLLLLLLIITSTIINAQKEFLDYIVTKDNDTIFGTIKSTKNFGVIGKRYISGWVNENTFDLVDKNGKEYKIKKKKIKSFLHNGKSYVLDTLKVKSIFIRDKKTNADNNVINVINEEVIDKGLLNRKEITYINKRIRLEDFLITINDDTIYGNIKKNLIGKVRLRTNSGEKHIISTKTVKQYRWDSDYYFKKKKTAVRIGDSKNAFLKLILNERIKIYEYKLKIGDVNHQNFGNEIYYFLEINDKLKYIPKHRFLKTMVILFKDDKDLVKRLKKREFTYSNMYLLVKEYNFRH